MARPGVMLYFDILEPIRVLSDDDKGRLLVAILEYGKEGAVPQFDGMLALAWGFVRPKIDRDLEEYERTVLRRQYATFCRERKRKNEPEISFEEWLVITGNHNHHMISHDTNDDQWYPTTTTAATTPITPSTTTKTATSTTVAVAVTANADGEDLAAATADKKLKLFKGELGQGVVFLSESQIESLLDILDLDAFDYYVSKLANFILKNDAKVKNHYETILKWWKEDSDVH
jgi:hypothetical protein